MRTQDVKLELSGLWSISEGEILRSYFFTDCVLNVRYSKAKEINMHNGLLS